MSSRQDRGFTLIEMVIVVSLVGLVATVIAGAFVVIVRTNPGNQDRADDARSLLGLTNYLPGDASSAAVNPDRGIDNIVVPATFSALDEPIGAPTGLTLPSGCNLGPTGTVSLAAMYWTEASRTYGVNYRLVDEGGWRIVRFDCDHTGSSSVRVSSVLRPEGSDPTADPPVIVSKRSFTSDPYDDGLEFEVVTASGETLRIDSASDNPAEETLEPVSTQPPPPVTSETNDPPEPAPPQPQVEYLYPGQTKLFAFRVDDPNGDPITIVGHEENPVGSWPADWDYLVTGQTVLVTAPAGAVIGDGYELRYSATDFRSDPVEGVFRVEVADPSGPSTTTTVFIEPPPLVPPPCVLNSLVIDPDSVQRGPSGFLKDSIDLTVTGTGVCLQLVAVFDPDGAGPGADVSLSFSGSLQATLVKNAHKWTVQTHEICIRNGFGNPDLICGNLTVTS